MNLVSGIEFNFTLCLHCISCYRCVIYHIYINDLNCDTVPYLSATKPKMSNIMKVPFELGMRRLFYAVTPNETSVPDIKDVPPYIEQVGRLCNY